MTAFGILSNAGQRDIVLVFIETDNGLVGVGEGWTPGRLQRL